MRVFTWRRVIIALLLLLVSAAIWWIGPEINIFGESWLHPEYARILVVAALFALWAAWEAYLYWRRQRARERLLNRMTGGEASLSKLRAQEDIDALRQTFETAIATLSQASDISHRDRRRMLYDQPWYLVIGASQSGKTALLKQSGLAFPLAERMGLDFSDEGQGTPLPRILFADQGVLIDTPGSMATHKSSEEEKASLWRALIELLIEYRFRQPINGIVLTVSIEDLLTQDEETLAEQARSLRDRLRDLLSWTRVSLPVYLVLTKADRLPGFIEAFEDLDEDERQQVWGTTFGQATRRRDKAADPKLELRQLTQRLARWMNGRSDRIASGRGAAAALALPQIILRMEERTATFVDLLTRSDRFTKLPRLRGIYMTSARQDGQQVDLLAQMLGQRGARAFARPNPPARERGYFISKVLRGVIFKEANLTATAPAYRHAKYARYALAFGCLLLVFGFGALMSEVFRESHREIREITGELNAYDAAVSSLPPLVRTSDLLTPLGELQAAVKESETDHIIPPVFEVDITPRRSIRNAATDAYHRYLLTEFLPLIRNRLGEGITTAISNQEAPGTVRQLLETYLMLGRPQRFDRARFENWTTSQWQALYPLDAATRDSLILYSNDLAAIMPVPLSLEPALISQARSYLLNVPRATDVYERLKALAARSPSVQAIDLSRQLGVSGLSILSTSGNSQIPGLYTRDGFYKLFLQATPELISSDLRNDWIFDGARAELSQDSMTAILEEVAEAYTKDYIANWESALDSIGLRPLSTLQDALTTAEALGSNDSPLTALFGLVRRNTDLAAPALTDNSGTQAGGTADVSGGAASPATAISTVSTALSLDRDFAVAALTSVTGDGWPGATIGAHFAAYRDILEGGGASTTPLSKSLDSFAAVYGELSGIAAAPDPGESSMKHVRARFEGNRDDALSALGVSAVGQPPPLRKIMRNVASGSWSILLADTRDYLNQQWRQDVLSACTRMIADRYPVFGDGFFPIPLQDFGAFFSQGGILDNFVTTYLDPFIERSGQQWQPLRAGGLSLGFNPSSLASLQAGAWIGDAFFDAGGTQPVLKFTITPESLDANAVRVDLELAGEDIVYRHGPLRPRSVTWPGQDNEGLVRVVITDIAGRSESLEQTGPWALFRLFDQQGLRPTSALDRYFLDIALANGTARFLIQASSVSNPFDLARLRAFRCPSTL
ncbi:MAG: type VI secretion system membrane subunit TssM [Pseudomonadota bacterium]